MENSPHVVIAYDATKPRADNELMLNVNGLREWGDILRGGDKLLVLGVLHRVHNPMGYQSKACPDSFVGASNRVMVEEVARKVNMYVNLLLQSAKVCEDEGVKIEVKITAGTPMKQVVVQEVGACNATWVILDRHLKKDMPFYQKQIPCKIALIQDNMSVEIERSHDTNEADSMEFKNFYSSFKPVPVVNTRGAERTEQSVISNKSYLFPSEASDALKADFLSSSSHKSRISLASVFETALNQEKSVSFKEENEYPGTDQIIQKRDIYANSRISEAPILRSVSVERTECSVEDSMKFSFLDIQIATDDFSKQNLLGKGGYGHGYGHVYKGKLKSGQLIAVKVRKEASKQESAGFHSEINDLYFARHKNVVMLLGYCCKEDLYILVYEYISKRSLDRHLFDKKANLLEWQQRYAIAIGTAKGLRFLHEECRGGPIVHRNLRSTNILLTHDFAPMLGDFCLAKWMTSDDTASTRYVAPEYVESGVVSVKTDIYAFGIVLLQLISGRKVVEGQVSLRQWAAALIKRDAIHELLDPRIGESYDMYELCNMTKAASLCVKRNPKLRPPIGEVLRLLEADNDRVYHSQDSFA